jgi:hypothetical protein
MGVKFDQKSAKSGIGKSRRFAFFLVRFLSFYVEKWLIGIYRKTGPTKSTVLGPGPPPGENDEIYRKLCFFNDFGVFNRAGKTVSKIGIYALPPLKSDFYGIFIYWGVTFRVFSISCLSCMWRIVFSSPFFGIQYNAIL